MATTTAYRPENDAPTRTIFVKRIRAGKITKKEFRKWLGVTRNQYNIEITKLMSNTDNLDLYDFYEKSANSQSIPVRVAEILASRLHMESIRIEVG
jgi:hypothetical protein